MRVCVCKGLRCDGMDTIMPCSLVCAQSCVDKWVSVSPTPVLPTLDQKVAFRLLLKI